MGWRQNIFVSCGTLLFLCGLSLGAPLDRKESLDIESLKTKLQDLRSVLSSLENDFKVKEARQVEEQDADLKQFESQLSEADQQLIEKMKSKLPYLQKAIHQPPHQDDTDEVVAVPAKRGHEVVNDPELRQLFAKLSPEDLRLMRAHTSKLEALKAALYSKSMKQTKENDVRDKEVETLEAIKEQLSALKASMAKDAVITEGRFGESVALDQTNQLDAKSIDTDDGSWMQAPVDDTGPVQIVTEKCKDGMDCHKPPQDHKEMVASAKEQILKDIAMAKASGISTKELLDALQAKRERRVIDEEQQAKVDFENRANHIFM